ncbi:MAG: TetR/AcrR family transcriptional regulator [Gemmatimonadota bacterium]|nr:TetR/AcrR family transcriptional regulator [Gemmatimonadota bacterium]
MKKEKTAVPKLSRKSRKLLKTAHELFMKHGLRRVTVEEICREADVSKMTFYKYFDNKSSIARRVLEDLYEEGWDKFREIFSSSSPLSEKLTKMMMYKMELSERCGSEFLRDLMSGGEPELKEYVEEQTRQSMQEIERLLQLAQRSGEIRPGINTKFMMYMLRALREMFKDDRLLALYDNQALLIKDMFTMFYHGVLSDENR